MTEKVYPIIIMMNSKNVQIGSAKVEFGSGNIISAIHQEHDVTLKELNIQFKSGDWLTRVLSNWR